jgi:hypothetical protein
MITRILEGDKCIELSLETVADSAENGKILKKRFYKIWKFGKKLISLQYEFRKFNSNII